MLDGNVIASEETRALVEWVSTAPAIVGNDTAYQSSVTVLAVVSLGVTPDETEMFGVTVPE